MATRIVKKYYKPSLGKTVNHAGYTRKVKDAPERQKYEKPELEYNDFTPSQKNGIAKFWQFTSDEMLDWFKKFQKDTGKLATNIHNKGDFYDYVERKTLKHSVKNEESFIHENGWTGIKDRSLAVKPEGEKHIIISRRKPFSKEEEYDTILVNVDDLKKLLRKVSR